MSFAETLETKPLCNQTRQNVPPSIMSGADGTDIQYQFLAGGTPNSWEDAPEAWSIAEARYRAWPVSPGREGTISGWSALRFGREHGEAVARGLTSRGVGAVSASGGGGFIRSLCVLQE